MNSAFTIGTGPAQKTSTSTSPLRNDSSSLAYQAAAAKVSPRATRSSRHKRYSSIHRRNFAKLDSIASHYVVKCRQQESDNPDRFVDAEQTENQVPEPEDTQKDNGKRLSNCTINQTPTKKRRLERHRLKTIASQSNLNALKDQETRVKKVQTRAKEIELKEPIRTREWTLGQSAHPQMHPQTTPPQNTDPLNTDPLNTDLQNTHSQNTHSPNSQGTNRLNTQYSTHGTHQQTASSAAGHTTHGIPTTSTTRLKSTLFQPTAASRIKSSASMASLKGVVSREAVHGNGHKSITRQPQKSLHDPAHGLAPASAHRIEQMLNILASPPAQNHSLEETKYMLSQLPSTRSSATRKHRSTTPTTPATTRILWTASQAHGLATAKTPGSTPISTPAAERLKRSKLIARSSPNLRSVR